jgi:hypothetical protein
MNLPAHCANYDKHKEHTFEVTSRLGTSAYWCPGSVSIMNIVQRLMDEGKW